MDGVIAVKILFAGESWVIHSVHMKGFDEFTTTVYEEGGGRLIEAFQSGGVEVDYMPSHIAAASFPDTAQKLAEYAAIVLSDIGSNTLLLHNDTFAKGKVTNNRLKAIQEYVNNGGGFAMMGGYMSFQGIEAKAKFAGTPIEEILPIRIMATDDRLEAPEGVTPVIVQKEHPILENVSEKWPHFLGYNILFEKPGSQIIAKCGEHVFMAAGEYGKGRTFAFASDIAPHWGSPEFVNWESYNTLFVNMVNWLAGEK